MSNALTAVSKNLSRSSTNIPINLPGINMEISGSMFALCPECGRELHQIAQKINKVSEKINTVVNQAYCMGVALTNPEMLLNVVGMMVNTASAIAKNIANRMTNLIKNQITQAVNTITGTITGAISNVENYIKSVSSFLNEVENTYKAIKNFKITLQIDAKQDADDFATLEDCEFAFAMMAACLVNKLVGNKLVKLEQKITDKINKERC